MIHTFEPIYNQDSKILILGTFPSVKSREGHFYYHHPRNRFWNVLSSIIGVRKPETIEDKKNMLLQHRIALWDVIYSCDIKASSDSSIQNVVPNDIGKLLDCCNIETIYANGGKAYELYNRYCYKNTQKDIIKLPSTSPANASYSFERLVESWSSAIQLELF